MAYENYSQVSWTDGSPITGERLQQMSTNIQQVREATDDSPQGIKKYKSEPNPSGSISAFSSTTEIIALKNEIGTGSGNSDNRVTIDANRYYRVTLHFTGFQVDAKGAEDSFYQVSLHEGTHGGANTVLHTVSFTPPIFAFINVAGAPPYTISNIALRSDAYDSRFGAGTYSVLLTTGASASTNKSYFAAVNRFTGASVTNAPNYIIPASPTSPLQLLVEDVGGLA